MLVSKFSNIFFLIKYTYPTNSEEELRKICQISPLVFVHGFLCVCLGLCLGAAYIDTCRKMLQSTQFELDNPFWIIKIHDGQAKNIKLFKAGKTNSVK